MGILDSSEISLIQLPTKSWLILLQIKYFMTNIGILLRSFLSNISTSAPASSYPSHSSASSSSISLEVVVEVAAVVVGGSSAPVLGPVTVVEGKLGEVVFAHSHCGEAGRGFFFTTFFLSRSWLGISMRQYSSPSQITLVAHSSSCRTSPGQNSSSGAWIQTCQRCLTMESTILGDGTY